MMLRTLLNEAKRHRLWPIPVVAVIVAVAAPLLFLKPAPPDAPPASMAAAATAPAGTLPARAERLISGTAAAGGAARKLRSRKSDPFQAPTSHGASTSPATDDSKPKDSNASAPASGGAPAGTTQPSVPAVTDPAPATPVSPRQPGADEPSTSPSARWVDVRYGERIPGHLQRRIPRLQTFEANGTILAIFVKYSPTRDKAVFAIAPGTLVGGQIDCRRKEGLCRYVDIPAGKGVRLTVRGSDGAQLSRRLDVERIVPASAADTTATASSAAADGACLLGKMLALSAGDIPLAGDACSS